MQWPQVKCDLNDKDKCPGIIYSKNFATFSKLNKRHSPKGRKEVGILCVCLACANAERSEVRNARLRNEKRSFDAWHQIGTALAVSSLSGPNTGHQAGTASKVKLGTLD